MGLVASGHQPCDQGSFLYNWGVASRPRCIGTSLLAARCELVRSLMPRGVHTLLSSTVASAARSRLQISFPYTGTCNRGIYAHLFLARPDTQVKPFTDHRQTSVRLT